jgi:hypothetical protein
MSNQNNLENDVEFLDYIIRQLKKIDSRIFSGQIILAFRETRRLIAFLENQKQSISNTIDSNPKKEGDLS